MGHEQLISIGLSALTILNGWIMFYINAQTKKIETLTKRLEAHVKDEADFRIDAARTYATRDSFEKIFEAMELMRQSINERLDRVIEMRSR